MPDNDPRVFFAAERTLLAWVRTGLGLIGLGFAIAKFAVFLRSVHPEAAHHAHPWSGPTGVGVAVLGAVASGVAAWQHRRFCRTLGANDLPPHYRVEPALVLGFGVAVAGLFIAALLLA